MSYADIRTCLLDAWQPPLGWLSPAELASFDRQVEGLRAVATLQLWKPFAVSANQTIEALLRKRLAALEPAPDLSRVHGIADLLKIARTRDVLPKEGAHRSDQGALASARILRNWSAHYAFADRTPTELEATQTLALLVCTTDGLFPLPSDLPGDTTDIPTSRLIRTLQPLANGDLLPSSVQIDLERIAEVGSDLTLTKAVKLARYLRRHGLSTDPLARALVTFYGRFVRRAATTNARSLFNFVHVLKQCGLRDHARVFVILLPATGAAISDLLSSKSSAMISSYVRRAYSADKMLFRARLVDAQPGADVIRTFWRKARVSDGKVGNAIGIIGKLPPLAKAACMRHAPVGSFASWSRLVGVPRTLQLLTLVPARIVGTDTRLSKVRARMVDLTVEAIVRAPLQDLHSVPNFLERNRLLRDPLMVPIIDRVLDRVECEAIADAPSARAVRRILWDVYTFTREQSGRARRIAAKLLPAIATASSWDGLCIAGMLALERPAPDVDRIFAGLRSINIPAEAVRWERYQVTVALSVLAHGMLSAVLSELVPQRFRTPPVGTGTTSALLYERARSVWVGATSSA